MTPATVVDREKRREMSTTEYVLVAMTVLVPLIIAVVVTLWTLEQARLRSKRNRKKTPRPAPGSDQPPASA
jgi:hypothetical protein